MSLEVLKQVLQSKTKMVAMPNGDSNIGNGSYVSENTSESLTAVQSQDLNSSTQTVDNLIDYLQQTQNHPILETIRSESSKSMFDKKLSAQELAYLVKEFENHKAELHGSEQNLKPIEIVLNNLNQQLNELSSNLVSLHEQSTVLSKNLNSQTIATERLTPVILDLLIPPDISFSIIKGPVNSQWIENLRFINEKCQLVENINNGTADSKLIELYKGSGNFQKLQDGLKILIVKAVETIRDYIIKQIKLLRSSVSKSSQMIQQELLRVKEIFVFLKTHHPTLANHLQLAYLYTMKWYYRSRFAKYLYALQKLNLRHVDSTMVLNGSNNEDKTYFSLKSWIPATAANTNGEPQNKLTFNEYLGSIDKRLEILGDENQPSAETHHSSMPAQIAETTPFGYWIEFVFHQWFTALIDNVVVEYLFVIEFFYQNDEKVHSVEIDPSVFLNNEEISDVVSKDWFLLIFEDVYKIGKEFINWLINYQPSLFTSTRAVSGSYASRVSNINSHQSFTGTCDAYAILLMIRIIQASQDQLHNQFHIPVLEDHLNSLYLELWPRFSKIIDLNCDNIKKASIRLSSSKQNLAPTLLTQQFGQLLSGLLKLTNSDTKGEPIENSLTRIRNDFENIITKSTSHFKNQSDKEIFLYNNYFLIVNILKNENKSGVLVDEQITHFESLCNAYKS